MARQAGAVEVGTGYGASCYGYIRRVFSDLTTVGPYNRRGMETGPVPPEAVAAHLERVLGSVTFRGAERSRSLLRFIVEEALQGRADRLKDYTLGSEALGRGEQFDPRTDPIARVEASRLRSRLDVYYATDGLSDSVRISLPKGGYAPVFEVRPAATPIEQPIRRTTSRSAHGSNASFAADGIQAGHCGNGRARWHYRPSLRAGSSRGPCRAHRLLQKCGSRSRRRRRRTRCPWRSRRTGVLWPSLEAPMDARDCGFVAWILVRRVSSSEPNMRRFPSGPPMVGRSGSSRTARSSGSISRVVWFGRSRRPPFQLVRHGIARE